MDELHTGLDADQRWFFLSRVRAQPDWDLLCIPYVRVRYFRNSEGASG